MTWIVSSKIVLQTKEMLRQTSLLLKIEEDPYPNAYPDPDQGNVDYNA